ncbi:Orthogonal Bundle domain in ATP12 [Lasallia pustulata]|uniref:Orthogonal Bundle domain in ATP12 n=1 Tax=Lasallia pustulata TaxID=136370 RepID=A0A1W5D6E1_9LECA|nr:Orthogonal Bundle domain in ATP12 [Lasallia pustulata]
MKSLTRRPSSSLFSTSHRTLPSSTLPPRLYQCLHSTAPKPADPLPITTLAPPPSAPLPAASQYGERVDRRRRQAELLKRGQDLRASNMKPGSAVTKRFWKDVTVQTAEESSAGPNHHTIHLDKRPVRNPATKTLLHIPPSKPHLATAIALEWDLLVSAQQALKQHLIPLTSIASRAEDLALADQAAASTPQMSRTRAEMVNMLMRYLDTDTLLCWAPARPSHASDALEARSAGPSLRDLQIRTALPIIAYLMTHVWPGVEIRPVLDDGSIVPASQPDGTREVIRGWISGLKAWELAGLERAVLAGKSLCVGVRLLVEWSEEFAGLRAWVGRGARFGIEEAAEACSLEVRWQTRLYGEVEDTHDVEREDVRRQLGSVVLVVSGTGG